MVPTAQHCPERPPEATCAPPSGAPVRASGWVSAARRRRGLPGSWILGSRPGPGLTTSLAHSPRHGLGGCSSTQRGAGPGQAPPLRGCTRRRTQPSCPGQPFCGCLLAALPGLETGLLYHLSRLESALCCVPAPCLSLKATLWLTLPTESRRPPPCARQARVPRVALPPGHYWPAWPASLAPRRPGWPSQLPSLHRCQLGPPGPDRRQPEAHRRPPPTPESATGRLLFWSQPLVLGIWASARDLRRTAASPFRARRGPPPKLRALSAGLWVLMPLATQTPGLSGRGCSYVLQRKSPGKGLEHSNALQSKKV